MRIIADSSCDLYALDWPDFVTVPLTVYTDERSFIDDSTLNLEEMLDYLGLYKGRSYTSCPNTQAWLDAFEGSEEMFVMTVTSALSGSYNSAVNAAEIYRETHPEAKIEIIDSRSTGAEEILYLEKLRDLCASGMAFEEIAEAIREYQNHTRLFFSFFSLHNLSQNGRVNKAVASMLCALNIAVTGTASAEGTITVNGKARGKRKVVRVLLEEMEKAGFNGKKAVITHVQNEEAANMLKEEVLAKYPFSDISIHTTRGLCAYYMERRGIVISCETA